MFCDIAIYVSFSALSSVFLMCCMNQRSQVNTEHSGRRTPAKSSYSSLCAVITKKKKKNSTCQVTKVVITSIIPFGLPKPQISLKANMALPLSRVSENRGWGGWSVIGKGGCVADTQVLKAPLMITYMAYGEICCLYSAHP